MIRRRWLQMVPAALLAHGLATVCALSTALALASEVLPPPSAAENSRVAALVTFLRLCSRISGSPLRYAAIPVVIALASAPLLSTIWLRAAERVATLSEHAHAAAKLYLRALAVWAVCALYSVGLLIAAALCAFASARMFDDPRARALFSLALAAPFLLALIHPLTLLDTSNLALVRGADTLAAALSGGRALLHRRLFGLRAAFLLASLAIALLGLSARARFGWGAAASVGTFCVGQLSALGSLALRNLWLAMLSTAPPVSRSIDAPLPRGRLARFFDTFAAESDAHSPADSPEHHDTWI